MKTLRIYFAVLLACLLLIVCGKKGDLLPPLVRIPQKVESATLSQRGDVIFVEWKNPIKYMDGTSLEMVTDVEIWVLEETIDVVPVAEKTEKDLEDKPQPAASAEKGKREGRSKKVRPITASAGETEAKEFENKARLAASIGNEKLAEYRKKKDSDAEGFSYPFSLTGEKVGTSKFVFAVRVKDRKSRESEFSNPISFTPRRVPLPPQAPEARVLEDGIEIRWQAPGANIDQSAPAEIEGYNIYKKTADDRLQCLNPSPVKELFYMDKDFAYGLSARYVIRASASAASPYFESGDSESLEVLPKDVFPPAVPSGLMALPGRGFIALSWDANREEDFAGYKVRRRAEGEDDLKLLTPQPIVVNAFTDSDVEQGKRYLYAVSSVDRLGNESSKSELPAESLKEERR